MTAKQQQKKLTKKVDEFPSNWMIKQIAYHPLDLYLEERNYFIFENQFLFK